MEHRHRPVNRPDHPAAHALQALEQATGDPEVRGRGNRIAWLLSKSGPGATVSVDARGRLYLPAWLRSVCGTGAVLVGARSTDSVVLVASTMLLDGLGDRLAEPVR